MLSCMKKSNNRSVMPLDVRGCTRATLKESVGVIPSSEEPGNPVYWDRDLQFFVLNEEFLVSTGHQRVLIYVPELSHFEKNGD